MRVKVSEFIITPFEEEDETKGTSKSIALEDLKIEDDSDEDDIFKSGWDLLLAFCFGILHSMIPLFFRWATHDAVMGKGPVEQTICVIHFVISFFGMSFLCIILRMAVMFYHKEARGLEKLCWASIPTDAREKKLPGFLDLSKGDNLDLWLLLREQKLNFQRHDDRFRIIHVPLVPAVLLDVLLIVVLFCRVVFFNYPFDLFTVLGVFDIVVLSLYIFALVGYLVKCNEVAIRGHVEVLELVRFKTVQLLAHARNRKKREQLKATNLLLGSAVENLQNLTAPITIMGLAIDRALVLQFGSLAAAGVLSGITKIAGIA